MVSISSKPNSMLTIASSIKPLLSTMDLKLMEASVFAHGQASVTKDLGILAFNTEDNKGFLSAGCPNPSQDYDLLFLHDIPIISIMNYNFNTTNLNRMKLKCP